MGDAGEGLIDAEGRIAERMEELSASGRARITARSSAIRKRCTRSNRWLARMELDRQLAATTHERRRAQSPTRLPKSTAA
jgi:hypothetical protein